MTRHARKQLTLLLIAATLILHACDRSQGQGSGETASLPHTIDAAGAGVAYSPAPDAVASGWPQWLGPTRNGISPETVSAENWGSDGPQVVWRRPLGEGFSGISVTDDLAVTMFSDGSGEFLVALRVGDGSEAWRIKTGRHYRDRQGGNGPRATPAIAGDRVYTLGAYGQLYAADLQTGDEIWSLDLVARFNGAVPQWGYSCSPLVDGNLVFVEAGGRPSKGLVALDAATGKTVWTAGRDIAGYSSPILIDAEGGRQAIFFTGRGLTSVNPSDGTIYWQHDWKTAYDVNAATPLFIPPGHIFISSEYDVGAALFELGVEEGVPAAKQVWKSRVMKNKMATSIHYEGHLYGIDGSILKCIDALTGEERWKTRGFGQGTLIRAGDRLIILGENGTLAIAEANPDEYREIESARVLSGRCWTVPSLANGKLYVRNLDEIVCLRL